MAWVECEWKKSDCGCFVLFILCLLLLLLSLSLSWLLTIYVHTHVGTIDTNATNAFFLRKPLFNNWPKQTIIAITNVRSLICYVICVPISTMFNLMNNMYLLDSAHSSWLPFIRKLSHSLFMPFPFLLFISHFWFLHRILSFE